MSSLPNSSVSGSVTGADSPIQAASSTISSESNPTVLVVGSGLSALCVSLELSALGCEVHLYEQEEVIASTEAGFPLTGELRAFLDTHGVDLKKAVVQAVGRQVLADDGECAVQDDKQQAYVSFESLRRAMAAKLPADHFHTNCRVVGVELADANSVIIEVESGERICGNLVIAADGMNSTLRNQLLPHCQPTYAGYLAWRGIARVCDLSGEVQHLLAGKTTMYKGPYLHMQVHPLAAADCDPSPSSDGSGSSSDGSARLAWTWYNNQMEEELPGLLLDLELEVHAHGVPLGAVNPAVADAVAAAAAGALPRPLAELVASSARSMGVAAVSDMVLSGCVISNKVAFVGKAGSVVRPHCISSAQKAVMDATSLAASLRASKLSLDKALPRWEQQQVQRNLALCHEAVAAGERMQGFAAC